MALTLYGSPLSPYVRAVRVALSEKTVEHEVVPIGPSELQAPDYTKHHPFRKLPYLDIDGTSLFETSAILHFIDEAYESGSTLQPSDPLERAYSEQWMSAANSYLYPDAFTDFFFQIALAPHFGIPVDENRISASAERLSHHLSALTGGLKAKTLGASTMPTLGDILAAAIMMPLLEIEQGQALLKDAPLFAAWLNDLSERHSFQSTGPEIQ
ncbi:MAG: glutathione S-transferase family protein [Pseudomonadota bacterium]